MTEWMFQDGYGVEGQDVCSPASHQARCGVALDMGHSRPVGHKWAHGGPLLPLAEGSSASVASMMPPPADTQQRGLRYRRVVTPLTQRNCID